LWQRLRLRQAPEEEEVFLPSRVDKASTGLVTRRSPEMVFHEELQTDFD